MRLVIAIVISGMVHAGCYGLLHGLGDRDPAVLSITQGRSSVQLVASLPSMPHPAAEEVVAWDPLLVIETEPETPPAPMEPAEQEEENPGEDPDPISKDASDEPAEESVSEPIKAPDPDEEQPTKETSSPRPAQQATTKSESDPAAHSDAFTAASVGSEAFNGAEFDDLPRQAAANPPPAYPHEAYRAGLQGVVLIRVTVSQIGGVDKIALEKTSGVESLDQSALSAVRIWRFQPALRGGKPVAMEAIVPIRFTIRPVRQASR